nr:MAG TPA: hypothetical protein [Bacteriophage sp.]
MFFLWLFPRCTAHSQPIYRLAIVPYCLESLVIQFCGFFPPILYHIFCCLSRVFFELPFSSYCLRFRLF